MANQNEGVLDVKIYTPDGVAWEGEAVSVSSVNSQGPFDLLPEHAHFVSILDGQPITIVAKDGTQKVFNYKNAVVRLFNDHVQIYGKHE